MPEDAKQADRAFALRLENFIKGWAPEDHYGAAAFNRDLHVLVREIYREAQAPLIAALGSLHMTAGPFPNFRIMSDGIVTTGGDKK